MPATERQDMEVATDKDLFSVVQGQDVLDTPFKIARCRHHSVMGCHRQGVSASEANFWEGLLTFSAHCESHLIGRIVLVMVCQQLIPEVDSLLSYCLLHSTSIQADSHEEMAKLEP